MVGRVFLWFYGCGLSVGNYRDFGMVVYTLEIDFDSMEVFNIQPRFRTDGTGFGMEAFHRGMPDLEYDRDVPSDYGKEE